MKWINLSELFRQPDWPETLTQEQHLQLVQEKFNRAKLYQKLQIPSKSELNKESYKCLKQL
jgi:hypothetical protein